MIMSGLVLLLLSHYIQECQDILIPTSAKVTAIPDNNLDEFLDSIWNECVRSEREMYPDEPDAVDSQTLGRSLPYET